MRIIGGELRHRQINAPQGKEFTRPITDRVKQSLFDRLTVMELLDDGYVLDLFAGSGGLGLEALSRGSDHCTFVEKNPKVLPVLKGNIQNLEMDEYSTIAKADALSGAWLNMVDKKPVQVVFCDPPYVMCENEEDWSRVAAMIELTANVMKSRGLLVLRTHERAKPTPIVGFNKPKRFDFGSMAVHFYWRL